MQQVQIACKAGKLKDIRHGQKINVHFPVELRSLSMWGDVYIHIEK